MGSIIEGLNDTEHHAAGYAARLFARGPEEATFITIEAGKETGA